MLLTLVKFGLRELLKDPIRRQDFFKSITQDEIAAQIRTLRKKRNLTQTALARLSGMKQSAVSRIEKAEYSSWTLATLFRVAAGLNGRWRMILEPAEEAIQEYNFLEAEAQTETAPARDYRTIDDASQASTTTIVFGKVGKSYGVNIATAHNFGAPIQLTPTLQ
jgi:transcriptional regulator with XRE-family HTH domain